MGCGIVSQIFSVFLKIVILPGSPVLALPVDHVNTLHDQDVLKTFRRYCNSFTPPPLTPRLEKKFDLKFHLVEELLSSCLYTSYTKCSAHCLSAASLADGPSVNSVKVLVKVPEILELLPRSEEP